MQVKKMYHGGAWEPYLPTRLVFLLHLNMFLKRFTAYTSLYSRINQSVFMSNTLFLFSGKELPLLRNFHTCAG